MLHFKYKNAFLIDMNKWPETFIDIAKLIENPKADLYNRSLFEEKFNRKHFERSIILEVTKTFSDFLEILNSFSSVSIHYDLDMK